MYISSSPVAGIANLGGKNVQFVFITANYNEYKSLMSFLGQPKTGYLLAGTTFNDFSKLQNRIEYLGIYDDYDLFNVIVKHGEENKCFAVLKCLSMGSTGNSGSRIETLKFLLTARKQAWCPEAIFVVGCCGGRELPPVHDKATVVGQVYVASKIIHYNRGKIEKGGKMKWKPSTNYGSDCTNWCLRMQRRNEKLCEKGAKMIPCQAIDRFVSGDYVVKDKTIAEVLASYSVDEEVGIEMEGLGVAEAVEIAKMINKDVIKGTDGRELALPEYVIVKGVSDIAGEGKKEPCDMHFFDQMEEAVVEDKRQQMCTIMAATLVLRAIVHYK